MVDIIKTEFGRIAVPDGPCKDNYDLIERFSHDGQVIILQRGAMESYKDACRAYGNRTRGSAFRIIHCTGTARSCDLQRQLYNSDPQRFAHPDVSLHCRALAIDVATPVPKLVRQLLMHRGWKQVRPDDEPWHFSYHFEA